MMIAIILGPEFTDCHKTIIAFGHIMNLKQKKEKRIVSVGG